MSSSGDDIEEPGDCLGTSSGSARNLKEGGSGRSSGAGWRVPEAVRCPVEAIRARQKRQGGTCAVVGGSIALGACFLLVAAPFFEVATGVLFGAVLFGTYETAIMASVGLAFGTLLFVGGQYHPWLRLRLRRENVYEVFPDFGAYEQGDALCGARPIIAWRLRRDLHEKRVPQEKIERDCVRRVFYAGLQNNRRARLEVVFTVPGERKPAKTRLSVPASLVACGLSNISLRQRAAEKRRKEKGKGGGGREGFSPSFSRKPAEK